MAGIFGPTVGRIAARIHENLKLDRLTGGLGGSECLVFQGAEAAHRFVHSFVDFAYVQIGLRQGVQNPAGQSGSIIGRAHGVGRAAFLNRLQQQVGLLGGDLALAKQI